jgi:hypothetical protein
MKTYLDVPYAEKNRAKDLGARFDMSRKQWYCPDGVDLMLFKEWVLGLTGTETKPARRLTAGPARRMGNPVICQCPSPPWERCPHSFA